MKTRKQLLLDSRCRDNVNIFVLTVAYLCYKPAVASIICSSLQSG